MRFRCEAVPGMITSRAAALGCVSTELAITTFQACGSSANLARRMPWEVEMEE